MNPAELDWASSRVSSANTRARRSPEQERAREPTSQLSVPPDLAENDLVRSGALRRRERHARLLVLAVAPELDRDDVARLVELERVHEVVDVVDLDVPHPADDVPLEET